MKKAMQEGIFHVKLEHSSFAGDNNAMNSANGDGLHDRAKGFRVIDARLLMKPFGEEMCFVVLNRSIRATFDAKNPFAANRQLMSRWLEQRPSVVFEKCIDLFRHGRSSFKTFDSMSEACG